MLSKIGPYAFVNKGFKLTFYVFIMSSESMFVFNYTTRRCTIVRAQESITHNLSVFMLVFFSVCIYNISYCKVYR